MSELHVALAADSTYVPHSAAALHSVAINGGDVVAHYLHGPDVPAAALGQIAEMVNRLGGRISFHEIEAGLVEDLPSDEMFGRAVWYRIFLPQLLERLDRILYLDVDTIVLDRLDTLREVDLDGCLLGAVGNVFMPYHRRRAQQLGIPTGDYFNSGVLLFNLEEMRRQQYTASVQELARAAVYQLEWPDQDALNLAAGGRWQRIHPRWNCMNSFFFERKLADEAIGAEAVSESIRHPAIRHFEGPGYNKPWNARHPLYGQRLYRFHRRQTPWPRYTLAEDSPRRTVRRLAAHMLGAPPR